MFIYNISNSRLIKVNKSAVGIKFHNFENYFVNNSMNKYDQTSNSHNFVLRRRMQWFDHQHATLFKEKRKIPVTYRHKPVNSHDDVAKCLPSKHKTFVDL